MLSFELSQTIRYFVCLQKYENKDIDVKLLELLKYFRCGNVKYRFNLVSSVKSGLEYYL